MNPTPRQLVHYVARYGAGKADYASRCRAAVITTVHPSTGAGTLADIRGPEEVDLAVLDPNRPFFDKACRHSEGSQSAGTWHWADGCRADPWSELQHSTPAPATAAPAPRPFTELRESGLLWLINRVVFHPRGLALALHTGDGAGDVHGWSLLSNDDGEPWQFDGATDTEGQARAAATLAAALNREGEAT